MMTTLFSEFFLLNRASFSPPYKHPVKGLSILIHGILNMKEITENHVSILYIVDHIFCLPEPP